MAKRALELLALPADGQSRLILDIGCGSGLGGAVLEAAGHAWIGMDISPSMLRVATERIGEDEDEDADADHSMASDDEEDDNQSDISESSESSDDSDGESSDPTAISPSSIHDFLLADMGQGVGFRPGTFDGAISISALQWLCHSNKSSERPRDRLTRLFRTLFASLSRGARAVFQLYPDHPSQLDLILGCATKAGFSGGLVVDYPHSARARKYYLCLMSGSAAFGSSLPAGLQGDEMQEQEEQVDCARRRRQLQEAAASRKKRKRPVKDREWVLRKKELARKRGQEVAPDSKYTARKRRIKF